VLARFVSADTIIPGQSSRAGAANPQELNRYSYVNNNPIRYTDPTGHIGSENQFEEAGFAGTGPYCPTCGSEPVAEPVAELVVEPVVEPVAEPIVEAGETGYSGGSGSGWSEPAPNPNPSAEKLFARGSFRAGAMQEADANAPIAENGRFIYETCREEIPETVLRDTRNGQVERRGHDYDHFPDTWAERKANLQAPGPEPTRKIVLNEYNRDLRVQCIPCNQGHKWEGIRGPYAKMPE
jgi:hypothetical protein